MKNPVILDWDNNGSIDVTDIGVSIAVSQEENEPSKQEPNEQHQSASASGCLTSVMLMAILGLMLAGSVLS